MIKFICYPKCTTCQRARKWLEEHEVTYELRDIKTENPTAEELAQWHRKSGLPLRKFFNTSGLAYGTYYLVEKAAPEGYTPLREAFEITVDSRSHLADNVIVIKNLSGVLLPETGGIGTTIFTLSGTLLLCVAAILFYLKKCRVDEG